jgi:threonine synthase
VVIYNPVGNVGYLSGTIYLTIKRIYNITNGENVTDEYDVPKRVIEDFTDELTEKVYKYFRISTDFDITYKGIS